MVPPHQEHNTYFEQFIDSFLYYIQVPGMVHGMWSEPKNQGDLRPMSASSRHAGRQILTSYAIFAVDIIDWLMRTET